METSKMVALVGALSEKKVKSEREELGEGFITESYGLVPSVDLFQVQCEQF